MEFIILNMLGFILSAVGGAILFLVGLREIGRGAEKIASGKMGGVIKRGMKTPTSAVLCGTVASATLQSSISANVIAVSLVSSKTISFWNAAAAITGANVGTTITSHLLSLGNNYTAIVSVIVLIIGLLASYCKNKTLKSFGDTMIGTGVLLIAAKIISGEIYNLKDWQGFNVLLLSDKEWLLALNGFALTSLTQSSSPVTGVIMAFAKADKLSFYNASFIVLGCNVGSCVPLVLNSLKQNAEARKAAFFNFYFNLFSSVFFFAVSCIFKEVFQVVFLRQSAARAIADFNTAVNLIPTIAFFPVLCFLSRREETGKRKKMKYRKKSREKSFNLKLRSNY